MTDLEHSELSLHLVHEQLHQDFVKRLRAFLDDCLQLLHLTFQLL